MRAPTIPGEAQDVFDGACPSCYYNGKSNDCGRRSGPNVQQPLAPATPVITSAGTPLDNSRKRLRGKVAPKASAPPHPEDENLSGDRARSVRADGKDSQDPKHILQNQAFEFACRVRTLPPEKRQAVSKQIESLLTMEALEPDALDMVRSVLEQPHEERAQSAEMILQILRAMLV